MPSLRSLLLIASLSATAAAHAEGFYVEGGSLARRYDLGVTGAIPADSAKGRVLSGALRLGYEVDDRWAVEVGRMNHGKPAHGYRLSDQDGRLTSHGHSWLLAGRAMLPLNERFALVGRLGLARNSSSLTGTGEAAGRAVSGSTTALYGGIGLETTLAPGWRLGVAWEHLGMSRAKHKGEQGTVINGLSTTLRYRF
ncbi:MAG: outer membrane beta-barrel protein [Roseateles sp.]|uniref:outer membrane beta-barrel protein n=1 Tax=Roseateles sp. TaxID=1971397 RepID=UPI004035E901